MRYLCSCEVKCAYLKSPSQRSQTNFSFLIFALKLFSSSLIADTFLQMDGSDRLGRNKQRVPSCGRCLAHGNSTALKGHKRVCPWRGCACVKCELVMNKRMIMAAQIKLRRQQVKEELKKKMEPNSIKAISGITYRI